MNRQLSKVNGMLKAKVDRLAGKLNLVQKTCQNYPKCWTTFGIFSLLGVLDPNLLTEGQLLG